VLVCGYMDCRWASGAFQAKEFDADTDTVSNTKAGVWAAIAVFLGYCLLQAPPTILVRPHPSFWRLIHGIAVVYMVFLTFLLFQKRDDARRFLKFLHPELGLELKERSYGADCRIYTPENPTNRFANVWVGDCPRGFCMPSKQRLPGFLSGSGQSDLDLSVEWSNA
jgi:phosphatidylserine synthase 2